MVRRWSGRFLRWVALGFVVVVALLWAGNLILTLRGQVRTRDATIQADQKLIAVRDAQIRDRDTALANQHITVNAPTPNVTVTVPPAKSTVVTTPGVTKVVPLPAPFPVPGPTVTTTPPPKPPPCQTLNLLGICL